jgi:hypothetical protein
MTMLVRTYLKTHENLNIHDAGNVTDRSNPPKKKLSLVARLSLKPLKRKPSKKSLDQKQVDGQQSLSGRKPSSSPLSR